MVGTGFSAALRAAKIAAAVRPDAITMLVVFAQTVLGLVMIQSASQYADPFDPGVIARRALLWAALGGLALALTTHIDYHWWAHVALPGITGACVLLAIVLQWGISVGGAQRWLALGSFITFQPSEIAKLAFILFAAAWLTQADHPFSARHLAIYGTVAAGVIGLVLVQNDLGTALVIAGCAVLLPLAAGVPLRHLAPATALAAVAGALVIAGTSFRRARILAFMHPMACGADGPSHHICESLLALGSGGVVGRGLGQGLQKAGYLPAPYTDSIFAVIGEELGLVGTLLVVVLIAALLWRGLRIASRAPDGFGALLALGVTSWIVVQAILNIGSSVAALPFTGVPLPFISFGGSSLVILMTAVGILLNVSAQSNGNTARTR